MILLLRADEHIDFIQILENKIRTGLLSIRIVLSVIYIKFELQMCCKEGVTYLKNKEANTIMRNYKKKNTAVIKIIESCNPHVIEY